MEDIKLKPPVERQKKKRRFTRRVFLFLIVLFAAGYIFFFRGPRRRYSKKKLVILGFDGADPRFVEDWWEDLPNLRKLRDQGTYTRLASSNPPESPVAWASFAVGGNPGQHGIYDFLRRPVGSYIPTEESFVGREFPKFILGGIPVKMPKAISKRGGTAFWEVLSENGVATTMLEVPTTFPPPVLHHGYALSGLGVPDSRGVQATFHHFISESEDEENTPGETIFGGKVEVLKKDEENPDLLIGRIWGPYDPVVEQEVRQEEKKLLKIDLEWCEWQAQLFSIKGRERIAEKEMYLLASHFGKRVLQSIALHPYMRDEELDPRIERMKRFINTFLDGGEPFFKNKNAEANVTRQHLSEAWKRSSDLWDKIRTMREPVLDRVTFDVLDENTVEIHIRDQKKVCSIHKWSDWFRIEFRINKFVSVYAIARFYPQEIGNNISIFMSSPDIDPSQPPIPISYPSNFSKKLVDWTDGLYKTRGWAAETHGLKDGHLSEEGFMEDLLDLIEKRRQKTLAALDRNDSNVFVSVISDTDRVSHMFMHHVDQLHPLYDSAKAEKYKDFIKEIFIRMDNLVGEVMDRIQEDPDTVLMVMSDHGFMTWRHQVNLNKWLVDNGFMAIKGGGSLLNSEMTLKDLMQKNMDSYFSYVDWSKTKAYALGLGQIYLNLEGREPLGSVKKEEYDQVCQEIKEKLEQLVDERPQYQGQKPISFVGKRDDIWKGNYANDEHDAPDLQVCFNKGYRVSWQTCLGGISPKVIEDNMEKWSGDHCSIDPAHVPGILLCNKKLNVENPSIYDFAPTVLDYFGLKKPSAMEGKNLLG